MSLRFVFCVNARVFRRKTRAEKENVQGTRWKRARREERRRGGDVSVDARVGSRARSVGCHRRLDRARVADPFRVRERGAPGDSPRSTDSTPLFRFWRANGTSRRGGGGGGTEGDERHARPRTRRGRRRARSMRRDGRARTLEAGDASGVVAREPHALANTSRRRGDRQGHRSKIRKKSLARLAKLAIAGSLARGFGPLRVTSGAARQGDTGVPRRGTAYAKHFAWPPPARARRETHRGSSRLADG